MRTLCFALIAILAAAGAAWASPAAASRDEVRRCMKCHGMQGAVKKFQNGESASVYVDSQAIERSIHGSLSCSDCHEDFSDDAHPKRDFRSLKQYRIKEARSCRHCHREDILRSRAIHAALLDRESEGEAAICTDCHTAHSVASVVHGAAFNSEAKYCMGCHAAGSGRMAFQNGEERPTRVDVSVLRASPHGNLSCSDCHFGFSSEGHPKRRFRTGRDYVLASSEVCKRCHFDKYAKVAEGIHYEALSRGRLDAPTCTDCHGGHSAKYMDGNRVETVGKCRRCHEDVFSVYARSVHGSALYQEDNRDVPICIDCHSPHSTADPFARAFHEQIPQMCSNCHADKSIMGKYGLSTDVVKSYLADFHGVALGLHKDEPDERYRPERPIAVCTDCHGTHGIARATGPESALLKKNLLARCRTCHEKASENFPDAWLSHYEPSLKTAPVVYIVNSIYGVMMPLMVLGLLLQVFLHIWRYLVNR